jgi:hypothetical protein
MIMFLKRVGEDHPGFRYGTPDETRVPPCFRMEKAELGAQRDEWIKNFGREYVIVEQP